jgi:hypothetical protein
MRSSIRTPIAARNTNTSKPFRQRRDVPGRLTAGADAYAVADWRSAAGYRVVAGPATPNSAIDGEYRSTAGRIARPLPSEGKAHTFESCRARHFPFVESGAPAFDLVRTCPNGRAIRAVADFRIEARLFLKRCFELRDQSRKCCRLLTRREVAAGQTLDPNAEISQSFPCKVDLAVLKDIFVTASH